MSHKPFVWYVIGPYRARGIWKYVPVVKWLIVEWNIRAARKAALRLWRTGDVVICPHMNTAHFDGEAPDAVWLNGGIELMRRCDGVFCRKGWKQSIGSVNEHEQAMEWGMDIAYEEGA